VKRLKIQTQRDPHKDLIFRRRILQAGGDETSAKHPRIFDNRALWKMPGNQPISEYFLRIARRKLAVFSRRNGLSKVFRKKKLCAGKTYPQLWISLVVQTSRVLIDIIHSTINRCAVLIAIFFIVVTSFCLDKTKLKKYNLLLFAPSSSRQSSYCAGIFGVFPIVGRARVKFVKIKWRWPLSSGG
jgi:hypothetical protein